MYNCIYVCVVLDVGPSLGTNSGEMYINVPFPIAVIYVIWLGFMCIIWPPTGLAWHSCLCNALVVYYVHIY